jgi:hypothetical protein
MPSLLPEHTRPPSCIMCMDKNAVPARRQCALEALVLIHKLPSCIMCRDKAAALATGACILEVLVLLHRPQCCIMRMDKHDVHATGACTLDVLVLMNHHDASCAGTEMRSLLQQHALWKCWSCCTNQSCTMCRDKAVVLASRACIMELMVLLHTPPCCIMCGDKKKSLLQEHALWTCWSCSTTHNPASCALRQLLSLLQEHAFWKCWSCYTDHHAASCAVTAMLSLLQGHAL